MWNCSAKLNGLSVVLFEVAISIYSMSRPNLLFTASKSELLETPEIKILSVALLSQSKNLSVAWLS